MAYIEPMLAKVCDEKLLAKFPEEFYIQPKLDGHRAIWDGKKLWSRTGKEILSVPLLLDLLRKHFSGIPLDGELYAKELSFEDFTKSARRTVNIQEDVRIKYHVFDSPTHGIFEDRWDAVDDAFQNSGMGHKHSNRIVCVPCIRVTKKSHPTEAKLNIYSSEYEGTMARNPNGLYKYGKRSSDLLKLKKMQDTEAEIIGVTQLSTYEKVEVPKGTPGAKRHTGGDRTYYKNGKATLQPMIGALVCRLKNGKEFEIGTGFDHDERKAFWKNPPIGKMVTFQYQELTSDGIPRFPSYLRMREDL